MTVRPHPEPHERQHPYVWECPRHDCEAAGVGVNRADAERAETRHELTAHPAGFDHVAYRCGRCSWTHTATADGVPAHLRYVRLHRTLHDIAEQLQQTYPGMSDEQASQAAVLAVGILAHAQGR